MPHIAYTEDPATAFKWMQSRKIRDIKRDANGGTVHVAVFPHGMKSGRSSIMLAAELEDGSVVTLESSLRLFMGIMVGVMGKNAAELIEDDILAPSPVDPATQFSDEQLGRMAADALMAGHGFDPEARKQILPADAPERWENMGEQEREANILAGRYMAKVLLGTPAVTSHTRYGACPCGKWHQPKVR